MLKTEVRANDEALKAWEKLRTDSRIGFVANEPAGMEARCFELTGHPSPAPRRWMGAYLAAFAIGADGTLAPESEPPEGIPVWGLIRGPFVIYTDHSGFWYDVRLEFSEGRVRLRRV